MRPACRLLRSVFGLVLLVFEMHIRRFEIFIVHNFGFMASFRGRAMYFLFVRLLACFLQYLSYQSVCFILVSGNRRFFLSDAQHTNYVPLCLLIVDAYQTASLSFGLGIIGMIVGIFGLANGAFNLYVYYRREDVRKELEKQTKEILEEVRRADNEEGGVSLDGTDAMQC